MPLAAAWLGVDGVAFSDAYCRAGQPVSVSAKPLSIAFAIGAAPANRKANHVIDHAVSIVADRDEVRFDTTLVPALEAEANGHRSSCGLKRVVEHFCECPGRIL